MFRLGAAIFDHGDALRPGRSRCRRMGHIELQPDGFQPGEPGQSRCHQGRNRFRLAEDVDHIYLYFGGDRGKVGPDPFAKQPLPFGAGVDRDHPVATRRQIGANDETGPYRVVGGADQGNHPGLPQDPAQIVI